MELQTRIVAIIRFAVCFLSLVIGIVVMLRADDNNALRRLTCALSALVIYFNAEIGSAVYLLIGSILETIMAVMGVGFALCLGLVIMLLPIILVLHYLKP